MFRPLRSLRLPLPLPALRSRPTAAAVRYSSSSSTSHQATTGLVYGALGVAGLVAWTGVVFSIGERKGEVLAHLPHASPSSPASSSLSSAPEPTEDDSPSGAYNPETGEINWACPCLGGMADGPCGPEFKAAFSCFVYSEVEPKGVDCVEKFKGMQECFRKYPEIYGQDDLDEDEEDEDVLIARANAALSLPDEHFLGEVLGHEEAEEAAAVAGQLV